MNVKEIVATYLKSHGYDGLVNCDVECGCNLNNLWPCDCIDDDCEPAYKKRDPDSVGGWTMTPEKPKEMRT